jgi:hypothetical protein
MKNGINGINAFLPFGFLFLLAGCAADAPYTTNTVAAQEAAYRECVRSTALENSVPSVRPTEIAIKAGIQCQGQLVVINDKLREENRWRHYYGGFADRYTENLKARTLDEVAGELASERK